MRIIILAIFTILFSNQVFAYGSFGHKLICQLAYEQLPNQKQQQLDHLTTYLSEKNKALIINNRYQTKTTPIVFSDLCNWADYIKKDKRYRHLNPLHYINLERSTKYITSQIADDACRENCILSAIRLHHQLLQTSIVARNKEKQLTALMFIGHWFGDIHQPLHISFKSDRGGNQNAVIGDKKCVNLHQVWDRCLLNQAGSFDSLIHELTPSLPLGPRIKFNDAQLLLWVNESFAITKAKTTQYCKPSNSQQSRCEKIRSSILLSDNYRQINENVIKQQIRLSAKRLSDYLYFFTR